MSNYENMDDKDYSAFKKSLDHQRDIEFDESHWDELNQRMDEAAVRTRRPVLGWWMMAAAAMLTLLLGNIFLFGNLRETSRMNEQLQGKLEQFSGIQKDTVWREKLLYVHDTLVNEKLVYRTVSAKPKKYQQLQEVLIPKDIETLLAGKLPERLRALPSETPPANEESLAGTTAGKGMDMLPETPEMDLNHVPDLLVNSGVELMYPRSKKRLDWANYLTETKWEEKKTPFLLKVKRVMQPDGLAIGASGGALYPISKRVDGAKGWSVGLAGELVFSDHLRLRAEANYARLSYTSKTMDPNLGIPIIPSPGDDYSFDKARVAQNSLHFNFSMKYQMNVKNKLQPFVYAGYWTAAVFPNTVFYDFENTITGIEVQVEEETGDNRFISGFGIAGAGLSYTLNDHLNLQLEGQYRTQLSESNYSNPDIAALRTTLLYQF